jgi:hypothetical protein
VLHECDWLTICWIRHTKFLTGPLRTK